MITKFYLSLLGTRASYVQGIDIAVMRRGPTLSMKIIWI